MSTRKMARVSDPVTSHEAAKEHVDSGRNATQRAIVYEILQLLDGSTSDELASAMKVSRYIPARRLPELEDDGLVRRGDPRKSKITGRRGVTWWCAGEEG